MGDSLTIIDTGKCEFRIQYTGEYAGILGPVMFTLETGSAKFYEYFDVDQATAMIAAMQLVLDDQAEREESGSVLDASDDLVAACDRFDAVSAGVSADA